MSRPSIAELRHRYRRVDLGDAPSTQRQRVAAEIYSLWTQFGRREFGWREWAQGRGGVDAHREWRQFLVRLRIYAVPHDVVEGWDGNRVSLSQASWRWQALEGGLVCRDCGELFRPTPAQIGLAWAHNPVRCGGCS